MTEDYWNYILSLSLSLVWSDFFFAKKQPGSPPVCTSLTPHYQASLVAEQPTQDPSLSRAYTGVSQNSSPRST